MKYSIVTCTYNASAFLAGYFQVINRINYDDFEVVIVDDASTDGTFDVLEEETRLSGKRIVTVQHIKNLGPGVARNTALRNISGEKIIFLDVDDEIDSEIFRIIDNYSGYDVIYYDYNKKYGEKNLKRCASLLLPEGKIDNIERVMSTTTGSVWGKVFNYELIKKYSISFPELYKSEDLVFLLSYLSYCQNAYYLSIPLYNYTINATSLIHRNIESQVECAKLAVEMINKLPISNSVKDLYFCREIVYDLSNIYLTLNKGKNYLVKFWKDNPLPQNWKCLKDNLRNNQYYTLLMVSHRYYYVLKCMVKIKNVIN